MSDRNHPTRHQLHRGGSMGTPTTFLNYSSTRRTWLQFHYGGRKTLDHGGWGPCRSGGYRRRALWAGRRARCRPRATALAASAGARRSPRADSPASEVDQSSTSFGAHPAKRHHAFQMLHPSPELGILALEGEDLFGSGVHVHHHLVLHL